VSAGFQEGGGGGEGGGFVGGGGGEASKYGILQGLFGTSGKTNDPWDSPESVIVLLRLGIGVRQFRTLTRGERDFLRQQAKQQFLREQRGRTDVPPPDWARIAAIVAHLVSAAHLTTARDAPGHVLRALFRARGRATLPRVFSTQPQQPSQVPLPGAPPAAAAEPAWVRLLEILAEQWALYQQQKAEREQRRFEREAIRMSLSDTVGDILGGGLQLAQSVVPQILQQRAVAQQLRAQSRAMRLAQGFSASGVPVPTVPGVLAGAAGGLLGGFLGEEPGTLESGGILETLGLEGDLERTATFWRRTASGFRPVMELNAVHPTSGRIGAWTYRGRPLMYTRDLAICRDVGRVVRGGASRLGLRFRSRRRR